MFDQFKEWVEQVLPDRVYTLSRGMWVEDASSAAKSYAALLGGGGPPVDVDDRRKRFRVLLVGPRNGRQQVGQIEEHIELLVQSAMGDSTPCGAASVRSIGEPVGPGYTAENRPWYSADFEVLF